MSRTHTICDEVKALVRGGDLTLSPRLRQTAEEFADACRTTDQRLRLCTDLITRGLRVEALHQAELPPRLLDEVALLSFPDRASWDEAVAMYGLPTGAKPDPGRSAELNRAYTEQQPLEQLTRTLRRLCRCRAPLPERLEVVRELARLDPDNPVWAESLEASEGVEYRELTRLGDKALSAGDHPVAFRVFEQLAAPGRRTPPPADLLRRMSLFVLPRLCSQLQAAIGLRDQPGYQRLRSLVLTALTASGLPQDNPVAAHALQLVSTADRLDAKKAAEVGHRQLADRVSEVLEDPNVSDDEAELAYSELVGARRRVPEQVRERYLERLDRSESRRNLYLSAMAIVLIALGICFLILVIGMTRK